MSADVPFAVIYRWSVEPQYEEQFLQRWKASTIRLREHSGALGSCLSRADNGDFVAFARWPSEAARDEAFAANSAPQPSPGIRMLEETKLQVVEDLLTQD